jgi:2-polyprenyl-3-methyl-5-hydroxy-6-metoxy-1,4-benzoquinol methylase
LYLHELGVLTSLYGFDHDVRKIDVARAASQSLSGVSRFETGDLRTAAVPTCDTVLLLDVLHYLCAADQQVVVERAVRALRPSGVLLLRETNRGSGARARLAAGLERVGRLLGANRGEALVFLPPVLYAGWLRSLGLEVNIESARGALGNVLLVGQKPPSGGLTHRS